MEARWRSTPPKKERMDGRKEGWIRNKDSVYRVFLTLWEPNVLTEKRRKRAAFFVL